MPIYEYRCFKCKKKFEARQRMTEKPLTQCVHCRGKVERLISSGGGIIFKGSGFYQTDYKNKKSPAPCDSCPAKESSKACASPKKSEKR